MLYCCAHYSRLLGLIPRLAALGKRICLKVLRFTDVKVVASSWLKHYIAACMFAGVFLRSFRARTRCLLFATYHESSDSGSLAASVSADPLIGGDAGTAKSSASHPSLRVATAHL